MKPLYTARAKVTGGRDEGHGRTADGLLEVDLRVPPELGGPGTGTNPEQLFAVGFASCFESAIKVVGRRERAQVDDVEVESQVHLLPTPERGFKLAVEMEVSLPSLEDRDLARRLVELAHKVCPYSDATRGNIDVTISLDGTPVA